MSAVFDFRAQQSRARRGTAFLVIGFVVMAVAIGIALGIIVSIALVMADELHQIEPLLVAFVAVIVLLFVGLVAFLRILFLRGDGAKVAQSLGAVEITEDVRNPYLRRYFNVVEEMAIAAGLPRPRVFVIKHEQGINAFAAGSDPERAAVAVTHGALAKLTRAELAGVVAHEMAHIGNYDTRLNTRLMGMVFGLVALYVIGRGLIRGLAFARTGRRNDGVAIALVIGIGLLVLGSLGVLAGRILQSAISRRREYLADATGIQFTRNPTGLANALKKIGGTGGGSKIGNAHREEARHMFFAAASSSLTGLFATHPPLLKRIRALEPNFDPEADPIYHLTDRQAMNDSRADLGLGPWDTEVPQPKNP